MLAMVQTLERILGFFVQEANTAREEVTGPAHEFGRQRLVTMQALDDGRNSFQDLRHGGHSCRRLASELI
jgi:hypothetical protein